MKNLFFAIVLAVLTLAASLPALALAMEHIESPIVQHASWPEGLADLLNSGTRVYSYWVNVTEYFYYCGDARQLSEFLENYSKLEGVPGVVTINPGKGLTGHFDDPKKADIPFDWKVSVFRPWTYPTKDSLETRVFVDVMAGGDLEWDEVKVPKDVTVLDLRSSTSPPKPEFGIYLLKDKSITAEQSLKLELDKLALQEKPLIGMDDFVWYRWKDHTFKLTPEAAKRMAKVEPHTAFAPFVFVADGKRIYKGAFWTSLSSGYFPNPVIESSRFGRLDAEETTAYTIERAYQGPTAEQLKDDPRDDPAIKAALETAGKLK